MRAMMKALSVMLVLLSALNAEPFVLVTHPDSPIESLDESQVKMIYLKQRRYWEGVKLKPINLAAESDVRHSFEKNILKMSHAQLESYWLKQHYKGLRPPYRVESVQSLLMFIQKVEGAIGYIPISSVNDEVKVIYKEQIQ